MAPKKLLVNIVTHTLKEWTNTNEEVSPALIVQKKPSSEEDTITISPCNQYFGDARSTFPLGNTAI
jgi:hypothetical protein